MLIVSQGGEELLLLTYSKYNKKTDSNYFDPIPEASFKHNCKNFVSILPTSSILLR